MKKILATALLPALIILFAGCNSAKKVDLYINNNEPNLDYQFVEKDLNEKDTYVEIIQLSVWTKSVYENIRINFSNNSIQNYINSKKIPNKYYDTIKNNEQIFYNDLDEYINTVLKKILYNSKIEDSQKNLILDEFDLQTLYRVGLTKEALDKGDHVRFFKNALGYESPNLNYNMQIKIFYSLYPEDIIKGISKTLDNSCVTPSELNTIKEFLININKYDTFCDRINMIQEELNGIYKNDNSISGSSDYSLIKGANGTYTYRCQKKCNESCKYCGNSCIKGRETFGATCTHEYSANSPIGWIGCPLCGDIDNDYWWDWYDKKLKE